MSRSEAEILMWDQLRELPNCYVEKEKKFCPERKWAFDFSVSDQIDMIYLAIEIEGGAWINGRHTRGSGFVKDMEKYNHAALLGWRVLRFTPQQVFEGTAIAFIRKVLES